MVSVATNTADPRKVFVVHGRNDSARVEMFIFLRSIGLEPMEWSQAIALTGKASPYIGEVLDVAFSYAQAIVVLFTGDDLARLGNRFTNPGEEDEELTPQARPNVIFEAGLALGRNPDRTVLVQLGTTRILSDLAGRHLILMANSSKKRQELVDRLRTAGCSVEIEHKTDWHTVGNFDKALVAPDKTEKITHVTSEHGTVQSEVTPAISFVVQPGISISRATGTPGHIIIVSGAGFAANEKNIKVTYDGVPIASGLV